MTKKIVNVGDIACGSNELFLISGPCVIEDESIMMKTAEKLKEVSEKLKIKMIYKSSFQKDNRSSLKYYDGPGLAKGVAILAKVKEQFGFPLLTDIHYPDQAAAAGEVAVALSGISASGYLGHVLVYMQLTLSPVLSWTVSVVPS